MSIYSLSPSVLWWLLNKKLPFSGTIASLDMQGFFPDQWLERQCFDMPNIQDLNAIGLAMEPSNRQTKSLFYTWL